MMIRKYRSSLPASLAAHHSLLAVLRDTLFYFTDFQLIGPPFIIITQPVCERRVSRSAAKSASTQPHSLLPIEFSALNLSIFSAAIVYTQIHGPRKIFQAVFCRDCTNLDSSEYAWLISGIVPWFSQPSAPTMALYLRCITGAGVAGLSAALRHRYPPPHMTHDISSA